MADATPQSNDSSEVLVGYAPGDPGSAKVLPRARKTNALSRAPDQQLLPYTSITIPPMQTVPYKGEPSFTDAMAETGKHIGNYLSRSLATTNAFIDQSPVLSGAKRFLGGTATSVGNFGSAVANRNVPLIPAGLEGLPDAAAKFRDGQKSLPK